MNTRDHENPSFCRFCIPTCQLSNIYMNLISNYPVCTWKWALTNDFNAILSTTRPSTWKTSPISTLMKSELLSFNGHYYLPGRSLKNKMAGKMNIFYTELLTTNIDWLVVFFDE